MENNMLDFNIITNYELLKKSVNCIYLAITQDIPLIKKEEFLETNNRFIFAVGDYINENLRKYVINDNITFIKFKRNAWEGRIINDKNSKITYSIVTYDTLDRAKANTEEHPHYLKTLLYVENSRFSGRNRQLSIKDYLPELESSECDEIIKEDYNIIIHNEICDPKEYTHLIIVYSAKHNQIAQIELLLLDKDFNEVNKIDLMEYIDVNLEMIVNSPLTGETQIQQGNKEDIVKLKPNVKLSLKSINKEA